MSAIADGGLPPPIQRLDQKRKTRRLKTGPRETAFPPSLPFPSFFPPTSQRIAIIIENSSTTQGGSSPASCGSSFERGARKAIRSNRQAEMPARHGPDQKRKNQRRGFEETPQPWKTAPPRLPINGLRSAPTSFGAKKKRFSFWEKRLAIIDHRQTANLSNPASKAVAARRRQGHCQ